MNFTVRGENLTRDFDGRAQPATYHKELPSYPQALALAGNAAQRFECGIVDRVPEDLR